MYVGVGIMSMALYPWLPLAALVYFIFQYVLIVGEEERFLRKEFGADYEEYTKHVRAFLPRLRPYKSLQQIDINWKAGWKSESRTLQAFAFVTLVIVLIWLIR
jgi:hypothetical protein